MHSFYIDGSLEEYRADFTNGEDPSGQKNPTTIQVETDSKIANGQKDVKHEVEKLKIEITESPWDVLRQHEPPYYEN